MKEVNHDLNHDLTLTLFATVKGQCLEYWGYITLDRTLIRATKVPELKNLKIKQYSDRFKGAGVT